MHEELNYKLDFSKAWSSGLVDWRIYILLADKTSKDSPTPSVCGLCASGVLSMTCAYVKCSILQLVKLLLDMGDLGQMHAFPTTADVVRWG